MFKKLQAWRAKWHDDTCTWWNKFAIILGICVVIILLSQIPYMYIVSVILSYILIVLLWIDLLSIVGEHYFNNSIKPKLIKKWAKEIAHSVPKINTKITNQPINLNVDVVHKTWVKPFFIKWQHIFDTWPNQTLANNLHDTTKFNEIVHNEFIIPLNDWCRFNLQSNFYQWSDNHGIYVMFTEPNDIVLWKLTWDNEFPDPQDLFNFTATLKG